MTQMGRSEARQMLNVVRRLCGHPATGPSEVFDQSIARIKLPIAPPPVRKARGSESEDNLSPARFISALYVWAGTDGRCHRTLICPAKPQINTAYGPITPEGLAEFDKPVELTSA